MENEKQAHKNFP